MAELLIDLDTGVMTVPLVESNDEFSLDNTTLERVIYPQGNSQIVVPAGKMVIVTAYLDGVSTVGKPEVEIFKALYSSGTVEHSTNVGCCEPKPSKTDSTLLNSVKICGWTLSECNPLLVINIPGRYFIKPNQYATECLVTAQQHELQDFSYGMDRSPK